MDMAMLRNILIKHGWKPGLNDPAVLLKIRDELNIYFDTPEGRATLANAPARPDFDQVGEDGTVKNTRMTKEQAINAVLSVINDLR